jgi:hypothetical protein
LLTTASGTSLHVLLLVQQEMLLPLIKGQVFHDLISVLIKGQVFHDLISVLIKGQVTICRGDIRRSTVSFSFKQESSITLPRSFFFFFFLAIFFFSNMLEYRVFECPK